MLIKNQANRNRDSLSCIFNKVRKLISERESELKGKIADVLEDEEKYLSEKKSKLNQQLFIISEFKHSSRIIESGNDINVLKNSEKLYDMSQKALEKQCSVNLKDPFVNIKEDMELMHICKLIYPQYSLAQSKTMKSAKYTSGGYKPVTVRNKSKDRGHDGLKSTSLLKKGMPSNPVSNISSKASGQSPKKVTSASASGVPKPGNMENDIPNYTRPIHNKRKNRHNYAEDDPDTMNKGIKSLQTQSLSHPEALLRTSVDSSNKKKNNKNVKGAYDWKRMDGREGVSHEGKYSNTIKDRKDFQNILKKSTSLYEARTKHKNDRSKNEKMKKNSDTKDDKNDMANVPKLNQTKSSPINDYVDSNNANGFSLQSYRPAEAKPQEDIFDAVENWDMSRIEKNSEFEKSFKREMRGILPEERKHLGYEVEKRLLGLDRDEEDPILLRPGDGNNKDFKVKKVPASPASDDKLGYSLLTSNKDTSKHDLSRMMITVDQYIYVISGYKNTTLPSVERLNINKGIWQEISDVNVARTKFGSVSVKGEKIYAIGGKLVDGTRTDLIEEYDVKNDLWTISEMRLPSSRSGFSIVLLNEKQLIVIGGNDGQVLDSMDLLNLQTGEWSSLPSMRTKRDELAVTIGPDGKIYAIGGYGGQSSTCLRSVERFNFQTYEWEKVADLNEPRRALA